MREQDESCDFPPCSRPAVRIVRLEVDGGPSMIATCEGHVDWLQRYVEEDASVRILESFPGERPPTVT